MSDLTRAMLDDMLPPGPIWEPEEQEDFDLLLEGIADNMEVVRVFLSTLSEIRNPNKTIILSDLEREYGIATNLLLSESARRTRLAELVFGMDGNGTEDDLQTALRNAGFDVYVYQNDPAVDPAIFLEQSFQMVAGGDNAYAGRADAFAGKIGGELLVNGEIFKTGRIFTSGAGTGFYAGTGHGAGEYEDLLVEKIEYPIPTNLADWPLVFFVGGVATHGVVELVDNGGFETGDFTGWNPRSSTIDNTNPASGIYCSKLVATGSDVKGSESDAVAIDPTKIYTVKSSHDITAMSSGKYRFVVRFFDSALNVISAVGLEIWSGATAGYELKTHTLGPVGSGADEEFPVDMAFVSFRPQGDTTPNFTAYMDDVEFFRSDKQSIIDIESVTIDGAREDEFKRTILQRKPLHSWAALIVNFT